MVMAEAERKFPPNVVVEKATARGKAERALQALQDTGCLWDHEDPRVTAAIVEYERAMLEDNPHLGDPLGDASLELDSDEDYAEE